MKFVPPVNKAIHVRSNQIALHFFVHSKLLHSYKSLSSCEDQEIGQNNNSELAKKNGWASAKKQYDFQMILYQQLRACHYEVEIETAD